MESRDYIGLRVDCIVKAKYTKMIFDLFDHNDWRRISYKYPDATFIKTWSEDPLSQQIPFNQVKHILEWKEAKDWYHQISMITRRWKFQCEIIGSGEAFGNFVRLVIANLIDPTNSVDALCEVRTNYSYPYFYKIENDIIIVETD
jgi:hypothetical protein